LPNPLKIKLTVLKLLSAERDTPPKPRADEQYAWPRSHDAQIAKRRLHRRQVFWRSGVSTTSERQRAPTGHDGQTVAQERRLARSVGASRRSPRVWRSYAPGPHLIRHPAAYARF
jgi:hypothetical protein